MAFAFSRPKLLEACVQLAALHVKEGDELLKVQADRLTECEAEGRDTAVARELLNQTCDLLRRQQMDWVRMTQKVKDG
jgi:hypothetical protein